MDVEEELALNLIRRFSDKAEGLDQKEIFDIIDSYGEAGLPVNKERVLRLMRDGLTYNQDNGRGSEIQRDKKKRYENQEPKRESLEQRLISAARKKYPFGVHISSSSGHLPFDYYTEEFNGSGNRIHLASIQEKMILIMTGGYIKHFKNYVDRVWVREGILYLPREGSKGGVYLAKDSPLIANAREATECHRRGEDYYLTEEQVKETQEFSHSFDLNEVQKHIRTGEFGEYWASKLLFGRDATDFGKYLELCGIEEMQIHVAEPSDKPFVRQVVFEIDRTSKKLNIYGDGKNLHKGDLNHSIRAEGVSVYLGDQGREFESYTPLSIWCALDRVLGPDQVAEKERIIRYLRFQTGFDFKPKAEL